MPKQKLQNLPESLSHLEFTLGIKGAHPETLVPELFVDTLRAALIIAYYEGHQVGLIKGFNDGVNACEP